MKRRDKKSIYWDSCVVISWIKNEISRKNQEFNGVVDCVQQLEKGLIRIVTYKSVTPGEVLDAEMDDTAKEKFARLFQRRDVTYLDYNPRIDDLVKEIREYYQEQSQKGIGKQIEIPDAMHVAAAICYGVDALYTFDEGKTGNSLGLLELGSNVAGKYPLIICKPPFSEPRLFF